MSVIFGCSLKFNLTCVVGGLIYSLRVILLPLLDNDELYFLLILSIGVKIDGQNLVDGLKAGRAVVDYVRSHGPAILHVHTYRSAVIVGCNRILMESRRPL